MWLAALTAAAILQTALVLSAGAESFDGAYRGTLNCAKLSWTKAPLTNEAVSVAILDGKVSYSRVLYGVDRRQVVGQESGSGTIAPDGTLVLSSGSIGRLGTMKATYKGKLENGAGILNGAQSVTYQDKTEIRACTLQLKF
jgi:hypothetical protein